MKTKVFFIAVIIFLSTSYAPLAQDGYLDSCIVLSVDNLSPYSKVELPVRAVTNQTFLGIQFDLTFKADSNTYLTCDSVHWTDWFWNNPANLYYSGDGTIQYMKREKDDTLQVTIMALWIMGGLPPKDSILAYLHLTLGQISIVEPDGESIWSAGDSKSIRWISRSPWNANDSIKVDTMLYKWTGKPDDPPIRFVVNLDEEIPGGFRPGYLIRDSQDEDSVKIESSFDAGRTWDPIVSSTLNDGEYLWSPIPDTSSDSCLIRITSKAENPISVASEGFFTILADTTDVREEKKEITTPADFLLHQNYPNPFNPSTKIEFSLPERAGVRLDIYNIRGERVKRLVDETLPSGHWSITWNGEDDKGSQVASGIYFYRLKTLHYTQTRKMVLVR